MATARWILAYAVLPVVGLFFVLAVVAMLQGPAARDFVVNAGPFLIVVVGYFLVVNGISCPPGSRPPLRFEPPRAGPAPPPPPAPSQHPLFDREIDRLPRSATQDRPSSARDV